MGRCCCCCLAVVLAGDGLGWIQELRVVVVVPDCQGAEPVVVVVPHVEDDTLGVATAGLIRASIAFV